MHCIHFLGCGVQNPNHFLIDAQNWTFSPLVHLICRRSDDTFITVISGRKQRSREVCDIPADDLSLAVVIRDAPSCPLREAPPSNTTADQRRRKKKPLYMWSTCTDTLVNYDRRRSHSSLFADLDMCGMIYFFSSSLISVFEYKCNDFMMLCLSDIFAVWVRRHPSHWQDASCDTLLTFFPREHKAREA